MNRENRIHSNTPVDAEHFIHGAEHGKKLSDSDTQILMAQYKLFVETSESLISRRQNVNTFFLSVNSVFLTAAGLLLRNGEPDILPYGALIGLGFGGVLLCFVWRKLITSFQQLSRGKFHVIHALEQRLPARIFELEWAVLSKGEEPDKYIPFTKIESRTPWIFGFLQGFIFIFGIVMICRSLIVS